eukprot:TRINITY_DN1830_c0_g1_i4.p1 TRINITY_DN1830_c0_g1~~TRINITY_DN1830_c0_g1_i4.p1  ORF type:complete len:641 (-),score=180.06 TRINITY_DN1830_c0_g1_i4:801-2723(-)
MRNFSFTFVLVLISLFQLIHALPRPRSYVAAVADFAPYGVMHKPSTREDAMAIADTNIMNASGVIAQAAQKGSQIIVLPEYGLTIAWEERETLSLFAEEVPSLAQMPMQACSPDAKVGHIVSKMACLAKLNKIDIVFNMIDRQSAGNKGDKLYNTSVAILADGTLVAKYHKFNLYYEKLDKPTKAEVVSFKSSFGVRFGLVICFDLLFPHPAKELVQRGIHNIAFSTWWVNGMSPVFTAAQYQRAWAYTHNVNLLAAGIGAGWFNSGSGIYNGRHSFSSVTNVLSPKTSLVLKRLPYDPSHWISHDEGQVIEFETEDNNIDAHSHSIDAVLGVNSNDDHVRYNFWPNFGVNATAIPIQSAFIGTATASFNKIQCSVEYMFSSLQDPIQSKNNKLYLLAGDGLVHDVRTSGCFLMKCPSTRTPDDCFHNGSGFSAAAHFDGAVVTARGFVDDQAVYQCGALDNMQLPSYGYLKRSWDYGNSYEISTHRLSGQKLLDLMIVGRTWDDRSKLPITSSSGSGSSAEAVKEERQHEHQHEHHHKHDHREEDEGNELIDNTSFEEHEHHHEHHHQHDHHREEQEEDDDSSSEEHQHHHHHHKHDHHREEQEEDEGTELEDDSTSSKEHQHHHQHEHYHKHDHHHQE